MMPKGIYISLLLLSNECVSFSIHMMYLCKVDQNLNVKESSTTCSGRFCYPSVFGNDLIKNSR